MTNVYPDSSRKKKEREKTQINKIRNEKGKVTTENAEIQRVLTHYYEQLYGNKMDNLEEMDRFIREEIEIMNNQITRTEIEAVIKNLSNQRPRTRWLYKRIASNI